LNDKKDAPGVRVDARHARGIYVGNQGTQLNIGNYIHIPLPRPSRRAVILLGVAFLLIAAAAVGGKAWMQHGEKSAAPNSQSTDDDAPYGWGPLRTMYSINEPSRTAAFDSFTDEPAPITDERDFVKCGIAGQQLSSYAGEIPIYASETYVGVSVWINNASTVPGQEILRAWMSLQLPSEPAHDPAVNVQLHGDNVATVWDGCRLQTGGRVIVEYVPGSAVVQPVVDPMAPQPVRDEVIRSHEFLPGMQGSDSGVIPTGATPYGYIAFGLRVTSVP
jgi:hypothetical protein